MKVWISGSAFAGDVRMYWESPNEYCWRDGGWSKGRVLVCHNVLVKFGFEKLPKKLDELYEYDLSGKKPRLVCIWEWRE